MKVILIGGGELTSKKLMNLNKKLAFENVFSNLCFIDEKPHRIK